jgi:hypothetical protein
LRPCSRTSFHHQPEAQHPKSSAIHKLPADYPIFGPRPSHYAASLLVAAAGAAFAMRQILLHIMPGDPGYGSALLGYHYYTWAFFGFAVAIVATAVMLLFDRQFEDDGGTPPDMAGAFARTAVWLVIGLTAANVISTLLECGLAACPADPVAYELLKGMR